MNTTAEQIKAAAKLFEQAQSMLSSGPLNYYLQNLVDHSEALLTRFAPIKAGERAVIVRPIACTDGWTGCEKTLAIGQIGEVKTVDYRKGKFVFDFVPDKQWWRANDGNYQEKDGLSIFRLWEGQLQKIEDHP